MAAHCSDSICCSSGISAMALGFTHGRSQQSGCGLGRIQRRRLGHNRNLAYCYHQRPAVASVHIPSGPGARRKTWLVSTEACTGAPHRVCDSFGTANGCDTLHKHFRVKVSIASLAFHAAAGDVRSVFPLSLRKAARLARHFMDSGGPRSSVKHGLETLHPRAKVFVFVPSLAGDFPPRVRRTN